MVELLLVIYQFLSLFLMPKILTLLHENFLQFNVGKYQMLKFCGILSSATKSGIESVDIGGSVPTKYWLFLVLITK